MRDRADAKPSPHRAGSLGQGARHQGEVNRKRGDTLGLEAYEKISAVEGISLSGAMREDWRI